MGGLMDRWVDHGWMVGGSADKWINGARYAWSEGLMDGWMDG